MFQLSTSTFTVLVCFFNLLTIWIFILIWPDPASMCDPNTIISDTNIPLSAQGLSNPIGHNLATWPRVSPLLWVTTCSSEFSCPCYVYPDNLSFREQFCNGVGLLGVSGANPHPDSWHITRTYRPWYVVAYIAALDLLLYVLSLL